MMSFKLRRTVSVEEKEAREGTKLSKAARKLYYTAEFNALGDMTKNGRLSIGEFTRLLMLLGYSKGQDGTKRLWQSTGLTDGALMTLDQYVKLMFNNAVDAQTNMWRKLFAAFDTDGTGFATKEQVIQGLAEMGLTSERTKKMVEEMDVTKDGKVQYIDFLKMQIKQFG